MDFMWSGDTNSSWQTLRAQIADGLNTGLSGIPYWGTDTGGFFSTKELTAELYSDGFNSARSVRCSDRMGGRGSCGCPGDGTWGTWGRSRMIRSCCPTPDQLHNAEVEGICRKYLDLRYRLLPYLYSTVYQTHRTGMPVMRAMWLVFPGDAQDAGRRRCVYVGRCFAGGARYATAGAQQRSVYLPAGVWYDYWTQAGCKAEPRR